MSPGLLESVYLTCLCYELKKAGLKVEQEKIVPLFYEGVKLDQSYRLDLLIQEKIIVEIKAVESITSVHKAQLLSYLKLADRPIGLIINFNTEGSKKVSVEWLIIFQKPHHNSILIITSDVLSAYPLRSLRLCG